MAWLHARQPVVLPDSAAAALWLDTAPGVWSPALAALCEPLPADALALTSCVTPALPCGLALYNLCRTLRCVFPSLI